MKQFFSLIKDRLIKRVMIGVTLLFVFFSNTNSVNGQCISSQSSYLVPGCGNTEMVLNASQGGVHYEMINQRTGVRAGGNNGQGNGGSVSVGIATSTDIYFVRAKSDACPDSIDFGHRLITVLPPPIVPQLTGGTYYCNSSGNDLVQLSIPTTETGVTYELYMNGFSQGTFQGTGSTLVLGYFGEGSYQVKASRNGSSCSEVESNFHDIGGIRTLPFFEGFNTTRQPYEICWNYQYEIGNSDISFASSSTSPIVSPFEGSHFLWWNSANPSFGNSRTRMASSPINTIGTNNIEVEFYWYNNNNPSFSTGNYLLEGMQLQYSLDGSTWLNVGSLTTRHDNTLASGTGQWKKKIISLPAAAGNQATVYLAFSFRAYGGNNCALDAITVRATGSCTGVFASQIRDINHNSAKVHYSGSGSYIVEYGPAGFTPGTGASAGVGGVAIATSSSPISISGLSSSTLYDVYLRQNCGSGQFSSNSDKIQFTTGCTPTDLPYRQNFDEVSASNPTCIRTQDVNNDQSSWLINSSSGANTAPNSLSLAAFGFASYCDDWFFSRGLNLTGGVTYRLRFKYRTAGNIQTFQGLQIKLGNAADTTSMNSIILTLNNFASATYQQADVNFTPSTSGVYYIGFHGTTFYPVTGLYVDDIAIDLAPTCISDITNLTSGAVTGTTANFSWNNISSAYEYAFTSSQTPPLSGTPTSVPNASLINLSGSTNYYFHVRARCSPGVFGNWSSITFFTQPDCVTASVIQPCTEVEAILPAGNGYWNFSGTYPFNSLGRSTPGRERLYKFTVPVSGVYYLDMTKAASGNVIDYFYKAVSDGCSNSGWIPIFAHNDITKLFNYALGMLQAGVEYVLLLDNESLAQVTQSFRICRASVGIPSRLNESLNFSLNQIIPANSPKLEYLIDLEGNLVASFDFSQNPNGFSYVSASYLCNTGPVRRSNNNVEYLDRNFGVTFGATNVFPVKTRLYFKNNELQKLAAEPNDGIGDISSMNDLRITEAYNYSVEPGAGNILIEPQVYGVYDDSTSFIEFTPTLTASSFTIHGGNNPLSIVNQKLPLCPGGSQSGYFYIPGATAYQWQVDTGNGFVSLINNSVYSGTTTLGLTINTPPLNYAGYKYRCVVTRGSDKYYAGYYILRFENSWYGGYSQDWHDPNNWTCGVIPNEFMEVVISPDNSYSNPIINANAQCRSLTITDGRTITINSGFKLEIKGK